MSLNAIQTALEKRLNTLLPSLPTAWENARPYQPVAGQPYQRVSHLLNRPRDLAITMDGTEDKGILQIDLYYPKGETRTAAIARAQAIRDHFKPPLRLTEGTTKVEISSTPQVSSGFPEDDRWRIVVSVYWRSFGV